MTYRERREARAARREQWAESRENKARASFAAADAIAEHIPFGQPILVGHHSEKRHRRDIERIQAGTRNGFEHLKMAAHHEQAAAEIRHQLDRSIYSDDYDAVEKMEARIAALEAERDAVKAFNAAARKAKYKADAVAELVAALPENLQRDWKRGGETTFPSYHLSGLSANIKRNRDRLPKLRAIAAQRERVRQALAEETAE